MPINIRFELAQASFFSTNSRHCWRRRFGKEIGGGRWRSFNRFIWLIT